MIKASKTTSKILATILVVAMIAVGVPITASANPAPTILSPANNSTVSWGNVIVRGNNPSGGVVRIHLRNLTTNQRVDLGSGPNNGHLVATGGATYSFTIPVTRLVGGNRYRVAIESTRGGVTSWVDHEFTIRPAYATISSPVVTQGFDNVTVSGNNPAGGAIRIHLRNLTTDQRVDLGSGANNGHLVSTGGSTYSFTILRNRLVNGHRYRVAIECTRFGVSSWVEREFTVNTQLSLSPTSKTVGSAASNTTYQFNININSNTSWAAWSDDSWIDLSNWHGRGNASSFIRLGRNSSTASRTGTITVSGGGVTRTLTVTQRGVGQ